MKRSPLLPLLFTLLVACAGPGSGSGPSNQIGSVGEPIGFPSVGSFQDVGDMLNGDNLSDDEEANQTFALLQAQQGGPKQLGSLGNGLSLPFLSPDAFANLSRDLQFWFQSQPNVLSPQGNLGEPARLVIYPNTSLIRFATAIGLTATTIPYVVINEGGTPAEVSIEAAPTAPFHLVWQQCKRIFCQGAIAFAPTERRLYQSQIVLRYREAGSSVSNTVSLQLEGRGFYDSLVTTPGNDGGPHLRILQRTLNGSQMVDRFIGDPNSRGGLGSTAQADFTGDGVPDILVGSGVGAPPTVTVIDGFTDQVVRSFPVLEPSSTRGVRVAVGRVNRDGQYDIAVGSGPGAPSLVQVLDGANLAVLGTFRPFGNAAVGAYVGLTDINGDFRDELLVGPGKGGGPILSVFEVHTRRQLYHQFVGNPGLREGLSLAIVALDRDPASEIVFSPGGGEVTIANLSAQGALISRQTLRPFGGFQGLINVGAMFFDRRDLTPELLFGAGEGGGPRVQVYSTATGSTLLDQFFYSTGFRGGVYVSGF